MGPLSVMPEAHDALQVDGRELKIQSDPHGDMGSWAEMTQPTADGRSGGLIERTL